MAESVEGVGRPTRSLTVGRHLWAARLSVAVGAILLTAAVLRGWGLGSKSLWFDEAFSLYLSSQDLLDIPRLLRLNDTHPPLYYFVLHFWMAFFGTSETAVRTPSLLASVAVVFLTFLLGRRLAGDRVAVLAASLVALSPFQITSAQEARMYPFLTLLVLASTYVLWLALEDGRRSHWAGYGTLTVLALFSHHFAFLALLAQGMYVVIYHRLDGRLKTWALILVLVVIAYLPWLPSFLTQLVTARGWPDIRPPFGLGALTDMFGLLSFGGGLFGMGTYFRRGGLDLQSRAAILLPFLLLAVCGVAGVPGWRKRLFILAYVVVPIGAVSAISLVRNIFYERYFSFVIPPLAVLMAAGVFAIADNMRRSRHALAVASLVLLMMAFIVPSLAKVYRTSSTYDWRATAGHVMAKDRTDDFIVFIPAFARIPFEYYFRGPQARMSINPRELIGPSRRVQFQTNVDTQRMTQIARTHPRMWIIATVPIGYEARMRMQKVLAPVYKELEGKSFGLVYAFLWVSRVYQSPGER